MRIVFAALLALVSTLALANDYSVHATWTDNTPTGAEYTPAYDVQWRVNGGTATDIVDLTTPTATFPVTANTADIIEVRIQARNTQGATPSGYTAWFQATAPGVPTQPLVPTGVVITITPQ